MRYHWVLAAVIAASLGCRPRSIASSVKEGEDPPAELGFERINTGPEGWIHKILAHPLDSRLAVMTDNNSVALWNIVTRERIWRHEVDGIKTNPVISGAINRAGTLFALGGYFGSYLELRKTDTGEIAKALTIPTDLVGTVNFSAMRFSDDDRFLLTATGSRLLLFNLETGEVQKEYRGADPNTKVVGFNTTSDRVYAISDPYLKVWNNTDEDNYWFKSIRPNLVEGSTTSPLIAEGYLSANLKFAALIVGFVGSEKQVQIFDLESEEMVVKFDADGPVYQASLSEDLRYLSFFEAAGNWKTFRIADQQLIGKKSHVLWQTDFIWYASVPVPHAYNKDLSLYLTPDGKSGENYSVRVWPLGALPE